MTNRPCNTAAARGLFAAALFTFAASAQSASYSYFGVGAPTACFANHAPLQHTAVGLPSLGAPFAVDVPMSWSGVNGFCGYLCDERYLLTGFSSQSYLGTPLPLDLHQHFGGSSSFCGSLLVSVEAMVMIPFGSGLYRYSMPIPAHVSLVGVPFYQQVCSIHRTLVGPGVVAMGRGGAGCIGFANVTQ